MWRSEIKLLITDNMKYLGKLKKQLLKDECEVQGKVLAVGTILIASAHGL